MPDNESKSIDLTQFAEILQSVFKDSVADLLGPNTEAIKELSKQLSDKFTTLEATFSDWAKQQQLPGDESAKTRADALNMYGSNTNTYGTISKLFNPQYLKNIQFTGHEQPETDASQIRNKLILQGALQATSKSSGLVNAMSGARIAGLGAAGALSTGGILLAVYGVQALLSGIWTTLKENFSWKTISEGMVSSLQSAFMTGNFRSGDQRSFKLDDYYAFRNQMRTMGVREDKEITQNLSELIKEGIAGGVALSDAQVAAITQQAIKRTLGLDISNAAVGSLYRATQLNRGMFANEAGDFDLQRFAQNFANLTKASENVHGVQVSIRDWYSIFDSLKDKFRGTDVDFGTFQNGLMRFSRALTENMGTVQDVTSVYRAAAAGLSDSAMFKMFALRGDGATDLLGERLGFIRRGLSEDVGYNAVEIARHMLRYGDITGGNDEAKRDLFMRKELSAMGMGTLARSIANLDQFFSSIVGGDREQEKKFDTLAKDTNQHLIAQAQKLDAIRNPLEQIRDLLFGSVVNSWMVRMITGTLDEVLDAGSDFVKGMAKDSNEFSNAIRNRHVESIDQGIKTLIENQNKNSNNITVVQQTVQSGIVGEPD